MRSGVAVKGEYEGVRGWGCGEVMSSVAKCDGVNATLPRASENQEPLMMVRCEDDGVLVLAFKAGLEGSLCRRLLGARGVDSAERFMSTHGIASGETSRAIAHLSSKHVKRLTCVRTNSSSLDCQAASGTQRPPCTSKLKISLRTTLP